MSHSLATPVYLGVDYHTSHLQLCAVDEQGKPRLNHRCANDLCALTDALAGYQVKRVAIEACTGAADLAQSLVDHLAWSVDLAHSGYVAKLKGSSDKTDYADARHLAELSRVGYLPKVWLAPADVRELRRLTGHRQKLVDQRRSAKMRIAALLREHRFSLPPEGLGPDGSGGSGASGGAGGRWSKRWVAALLALPWPAPSRMIVEDLLAELAGLAMRLRAMETNLATLTAGDPIVEKLLTLPGVGPVTAWTLRAAIGRFDRFASGKQLARYCGLSPRNASSGQRMADAGLIRQADPRLRAVLIQAGQRLLRGPGRFGDLGRRMLERGKAYNLTVAAVTNRWLRWLFHQVEDIQPRTLAAALA